VRAIVPASQVFSMFSSTTFCSCLRFH